jgi:ribosomal protein L40E/ketosteroid isomerase-like protein
MVICPQCNIEHDPLEEFCKKCGKFLLSVEDPVPAKEKTVVNLICPRCQALHRNGKYCRKCGSLLMRQTTSEKADVQPLEKKSVKRWVKEWRNLLEEERGLESCMSKLEEQGDNISTEVINPLIVRYKDRLKSLQPLHQEIEKELESIRKRTTREIDLLEDQLKPVQKRLEEFQSLYRESALTKADFQRESQELRKEIKSIERGLKKFRHLLSLLPGPVGENVGSSEFAGGLLRPLTLTTGGVILFLIIAGGYLFWQKYPPSVKPISVEVPSSASPLVSLPDPETVMESKKVEKIESVFENIRRANLQKDIDLFMSCFSRDFRGAERKRKDTLKMWETFNYHDLFYDLKKQTISGDTADVRLEWVIRTSEKVGGKPHNGKTVLDVTLKREDSRWKIKGIKPVS